MSTDENEIRFNTAADAGAAEELSDWLADRAIEVTFRAAGEGRLVVDSLRDLADHTDPEPTDDGPRYHVLVEDQRVAGGFRRIDDPTFTAAGLEEALTEYGRRGRRIRFEPVEQTVGGGPE